LKEESVPPIGRVMSLLVVFLALCSGCTGDGKRRPLSGSVSFQGKPLAHGSITFLTMSGPPGPVCGALIRAGRYEVPASQGLEPGTYRVVISAPVPGGKLSAAEKAAGASPRAREGLPAKYNSASKLTVEVAADGPTEFNFNLQGE
jgi:hypothetical protein